MGILAKGLTANPTVVDMDLSYNILSDEGVRQVAHVLKNENSVLGMLNLAGNKITAEGCRFLAQCEDVNRSLVSLNLAANYFGDLGGKRILDWANNNPVIQRISMESCDIGEDSVQSFGRLMHNKHSALTALNISGNRKIGRVGGETVLTGLDAGKQMKELWIGGCDCGEDLETRILNYLVERKHGRVSLHHAWTPDPVGPIPPPKDEEKDVKPLEATEQDKKNKEDGDANKENKDDKEEEEEKDEESEDEAEAKEQSDKLKADEEAAAAAASEAAAATDKEAASSKEIEDNIVHVGHEHNEACTLACARMVGLPSQHPPPEPVVYAETQFAAINAQIAIKNIEDAKPYWGLDAMKDMKEKVSQEPGL